MKNQAVSAPCCTRAKVASLLAAFAGLTQSLPADTHTWDGSTSGYWGTSANWNTGTVPQDGDDLVFPAGPTRLATTNNTSSTRRYKSITLSGANYTLRGNSLTLSNGITATYAAGSAAWVELDIGLAQQRTFECAAGNSILYVTETARAVLRQMS
jgi:hypothetical protein